MNYIICDICRNRAFYTKITKDRIWMYKFYLCENCERYTVRVKRK